MEADLGRWYFLLLMQRFKFKEEMFNFSRILSQGNCIDLGIGNLAMANPSKFLRKPDSSVPEGKRKLLLVK